MEKQNLWIEKYSEANRALDLVKNIDFPVYIDRMRADNFRQIQFTFGKEVINSLPDIETIFATREEVTRNLEDHFQKKLNSWPDKELCRKEFLGMVVSYLLKNENSVNKIRTGDLAFLNFQFIGEVWSYSDILKKYLAEKPQPQPQPQPQPVGLEEMFKNRKDLKKLVELLVENGFSKVKNSITNWSGSKVEFVAMVKICKPLLKPGQTQQHEIEAWRKYFNFKVSDPLFSQEAKYGWHLTKFNFIKNCFKFE